jgi:two-component system KDP operon response regulator KdpE
MKALVIDDDPEISEVIRLAFSVGWPEATVVSCAKGYDGIEMVETHDPDVVILDILLPDMSGLDVLKEIRSFSGVPVIIVSVKVEEMERVKGLEAGADDYVCKPFSYLELLARVRAVLRRGGMDEDAGSPSAVEASGLRVNFKSQEVILGGVEIKLTPTEYRLLCQLVMNRGKPVSHQSLIEKVWGQEYLNTPSVLKVHIHRLRQKLRGNCEDNLIITVPRRGYRFHYVKTGDDVA